MLVPVTNFASKLSLAFVMLGVVLTVIANNTIFGYYILLFGIGLFAVTTAFQLVTLPCEFNASRRAMKALRGSGYYSEEELSAARKVLTAAALTYVAATFVSIVQLIRLALIFGDRNDRR